MKLSKLIGERYKEKPTDANLISHVFLLKGGYIRQVANGVYSLLPPAKRIISKIEAIIRDEMDYIEGQEVLMPVVMPRELWEESGRYESVDSELVRFKDRVKHDMVLGMTHEEASVHLTRNEALAYGKYPFMIYQIQTKFRDELRSRGGLIRVREFVMKDAYSFHTSNEDLNEYYNKCLESYHNIFSRVGIKEVISVGSDTGMMGGSIAHEFVLLCGSGEDTIALCNRCDYKANMEIAKSYIDYTNHDEDIMEEVSTPGVRTIEDLSKFFSLSKENFLKAAIFDVSESKKPLIVFLRGDLEVNEAKVKSIIKRNIFPLENQDKLNICFGFVGPLNLDKDISVIFDKSLEGEKNLICGANKEDLHIKNLSVKRDLKIEKFYDISKVRQNDKCPNCKNGKIKLSMGIEVGNIFQLGDKYTKSMNMTYNDIDGRRKNPVMGCYGIGIGRLMASVVEAKHDDFGPIWPISIAPWQIHICVIKIKNETVKKEAFNLYNELIMMNYEVIIDDRNANAGVQFADADLLGVPLRLILSPKNLKENKIEVCTRDKSVKKLVEREEVLDTIKSIMVDLVKI